MSGPWRQDGETLFTVGKDRNHVVATFYGPDAIDNARLARSAHDMLEALENKDLHWLLDNTRLGDVSGDSPEDLERILSATRAVHAAIYKAKGS